MSREDKRQSVTEHYLKLLQIIKDYPDILEKMKNKVGLATNQTRTEPVPEQATSGVDQKSQVS